MEKTNKYILQSRCIFLNGKINMELATNTCRYLISLETQDPGVPIIMFIMSSGGASYLARGIYDVMQSISSPVYTVCTGLAMSAAAIILSGGERGKRFSFANSTIMIHQPSLKFKNRKTITDLKIKIKQSERIKKQSAKLLTKNSNKSFEEMKKILERDFYLNPKEALKFGIIDFIITDLSDFFTII